MHAPYGTACRSRPCATGRHWRKLLLCTAFLPLMLSAPAQAQRIDSATPQTLMMQSQTPAMAPPVSAPAPKTAETAPKPAAEPAAPVTPPETAQNPAAAEPANPLYDAAIDLFNLFDLNKDGVIEEYETSLAAKRRFKKMDTNQDGEINSLEYNVGSFEESKKNHFLKHGTFLKTEEKYFREYEIWFRLMDANGDGVVTEYENLRFFRDEFLKSDTEQAGRVTKEEYILYLKKKFGQ